VDANTDPLTWCCQTCRRPVIDLDPYALDRKITPLAKIGDLMATPIPSIWRPFARRRWIRRLERRIRHELGAHRIFEIKINAIAGKKELRVC